MEIMWLVLLVMGVTGLAVGQSTDVLSAENGFVGESVLLSCPCSDDTERVAWQIGDQVVSHYPQDENDGAVDESYMKRTQLFLDLEKANCSLLLRNLSLKDAGVYTCHTLTPVDAKLWSRNSSRVNLTVSEHKNNKTDSDKVQGEKGAEALHIGVPTLAVVILAAALLLTWVLRRRKQEHQLCVDQTEHDV